MLSFLELLPLIISPTVPEVVRRPSLAKLVNECDL